MGWYSPTGGEIGDAPIATAGALGDTSYAFGMVTLANGQGEVPIQALYSNAVHGPEDPTTLNFAIPSNAVNVGNLAGSVRYNQSVSSSSNANNFYRFNLTSTSKLDVLLSGSGGDADIFLGRDVNADGRTDSTEIIRYSTSNTNQESISIAGLQAGSYYLIVNESTAGSTNYNLALTATATAPAIPTAPAIVTTPPIGQADLLWRNAATGQTVIWNINDTTTPIDIGGGVVTYKGAAINPGADWQVKATGNFGGSRNTDMLWRNKVTDQTVVWLMDGTTVTSATLLNPKLGSTWDIVGVGQFKGVNGPEAIVWQDSVTGEAAISEWNATTQTIDTTNGGSNYVQYSGSRFQPGAGWKIEGVGDYNGDGISDLLWRNGSSIVVWGMGGATGTMLVTPYAVAQPLAPSFKAVGSANFNGDGTADMLYRDATADRTIMLTFKIVGGSLVAMPQEFAVHPGSTWQIQGLADFNGDSNTDIVWRNTANTGANPLQTAIWALDGVGAKLLPGVSGVITTATNGILQPASDWNIVGTGNFGSV